MAKVSLSIKSLNSTDFKEDKVQKLESNDIPFEINDGKIYLISRGTVDVQSRTYNKPYSKFCMQIADSAKEASIGMGEGELDGEKLAILFQVFGWDLEFEIELSCGSEYESGTLITDEDPDTYEMIWIFSVEDSSHKEEENEEDDDCWTEEKQIILSSELKDYLEKKLDDCMAVNAGNSEDTVTVLEISKENFNKIENEKNFTNEIGLNEICSVRFDDYAGIEPFVPKDVINQYKKNIQESVKKLAEDEDNVKEWDPEYIIHNGFIYCEKKIILLYQLPTKEYNDAESGNRECRSLAAETL